MPTALLFIGVICTIAAPCLLAAALVRALGGKQARLFVYGAIIMLMLAVSSLILSSMLGKLSTF